MILDVIGRGNKDQPPYMLFADDIVPHSIRREHVEREFEERRRAMEESENVRIHGVDEVGELDAEVPHRVQNG